MRAPRFRDMLATLVAAAALWQLVSLLVGRSMTPGLGDITAALIRELRNSLPLHAATSLARVLCAIVLATCIGCPLGILLAQSDRANRLLSPFLYLAYPVPKVVFVPLLLLWFGVGNAPKIMLIVLVLVSQMLVLVRDNVRTVPVELVDSVRSLGAGPTALFRFVYLPASVPAVLSSLRQSIGTAFAVLYLAELVATEHGLGYYIHLHGSVLFDYPAMYAGILVMGTMGLTLFFSIDLLQKWMCPHMR